MNLPDKLLVELRDIYKSHSSNEVKEFRVKQMVEYNASEDLALADVIRSTWCDLHPKKTIAIKNTVVPIIAKWDHVDLQLNPKNKSIEMNTNNLLLILSDHPKFANRLSFNELSGQYHFDGNEIQDQDYSQLRYEICKELGLNFKKSDVVEISELVARRNRFHPVVSYLQSLPTWDQVDRIPDVVSAFCIDNIQLNIDVMRKWLIAAVARVMKPGCKVDSIPVFCGATGNRKSTALKSLCPNPDWFTDEPINFGSRDSKQVLLGKWIVELSELSTLSKKDANTVKSDITQTVDEFRSPYDRKPKKYPRQFVYTGTTNELEFLSDPTSNRRFWILSNQGVIDTDKIADIRDALWAQAYALFTAGEKWYLSAEQEEEMGQRASQYEVKDAWYDAVHQFLVGKDTITTHEILEMLFPSTKDVDNTDRKRVQNILQYMKWTSTMERYGAERKTTAIWRRPNTKTYVVTGAAMTSGSSIEGWN